MTGTRSPGPLPTARSVGSTAVAVIFVLLAATSARADLRDRFREARDEPAASVARARMERILASDDDADVSAEAGIWLGQYEYALGRVASAHGFFARATELATDSRLRARAEFWTTHAANLLGSERSRGEAGTPATGGDPRRVKAGQGPAGSLGAAATYELLTEIARGDAEVRAGNLQAAVRIYLEAEGRARTTGWLGPLAYRTALTMTTALEGGAKSSLFDTETLEGWDDDLAAAPERGLVFVAIRAGEKVEDSPAGESNEYAAPAAPPEEDDSELEGQKWGEGPEGILGDAADTAEEERTPPPAGAESGASTRPGTGGEGLYVVQLGAYRDRDLARREMEQLTARGLSVRLEPGADASGDRVFRIRLGSAAPRGEAEAMAARVLPGISYQLVPVEP